MGEEKKEEEEDESRGWSGLLGGREREGERGAKLLQKRSILDSGRFITSSNMTPIRSGLSLAKSFSPPAILLSDARYEARGLDYNN